jgi:hypothetical protein
VIKPSSGNVSQVNGDELDDKKVIVHPACPARKVVVLQPNARIGFTVIPDDVLGRSKMLREAHVAPECLGPWPRGAKAAPFLIAVLAMTRVACIMLGACPFIPLVSLMVRQRLRASARWPSRRQDGAYTGEDAVPTTGSSVVVLCRLALEWHGLETKTSARH